MAKMYEHDDGRKCKLKDRRWLWGMSEQPCDMDHWLRKVIEVPDDDDRGEFGMPGIGVDRIGPLPDRPLVIEVLNHLVTTPEAERICRVLPTILARFFKNNTKYARAQSGHDLGAKGIIPDINRKTSVLIDRIWYDGPVVGEPTVEVIDDLIGHLLLMRDKITNEEGE